MNIHEVFKSMEMKFKGNNNRIPIESTVITIKEWETIKKTLLSNQIVYNDDIKKES